MNEPLNLYSKIPVHIVEDHCDALSHIHRAIGSKHVKFKGNLFIHFDSHPDLLVNTDLLSSEVYDKDVLQEKISIESWILPIISAGHISTLAWVKPPWAHQINDGKYTFLVGKHKESGKICVSSPLLYFVSALIYSPLDELEDVYDLCLHVITLEPNDSSMKSCQENLASLISKHDQHYLLDVDLDFFSTINPFINMYEDIKLYERLTPLYEFKLKSPEAESFKNAQKRRESTINSLEEVFVKLDALNENEDAEFSDEVIDEICSNVSDQVSVQLLKDLIHDLIRENAREVDWLIVHSAGTTIDDPSTVLPHHPSSNDEIKALISNVQKILKNISHPIIITVARSSLDDYCPPEQVDNIQEEFCKSLEVAYDESKLEIQMHYKE